MGGVSGSAATHVNRLAQPPMPISRERILIVRLAALGDVVLTSTIVTRIRAERPGAHITWLTSDGARPLVELFGVDEILTVDERRLLGGSTATRLASLGRLWARLAGRRFDVALLAHADARYRLLLRSARIGELHMLRRFAHARMNPIPGRFFGDEFARLLDGPNPLGPASRRYDIVDVRPRLGFDNAANDDDPFVVIAPGGARNVLRDDPLRRWPLERYTELARRLAPSYRVVVIGDAGDAWVRPAFSGVPVDDLIGSLELRETLRLLARASLVISHDTGPIHLTRLVRAPLLALFGPTTPRQVLGDPDGVTVLWGGAGLACRPCFDGRNYAACSNNLCMQDITVEHVLDRAFALLGARRQATAPGVSAELS